MVHVGGIVVGVCVFHGVVIGAAARAAACNRPQIPDRIPKELRTLISQCWAQDPGMRDLWLSMWVWATHVSQRVPRAHLPTTHHKPPTQQTRGQRWTK